MRRNKTFQHALFCLTHPLSVIAILLLFLNAVVLQPYFPSWWTGKIGDAAWLLFAPFLIAALLAWLIPARWKQQEQIVGIAALTIAGFGFAAVKTIPAFNALVADSFQSLTGYPGKLSLDPTDLLTLPSLLAAGWLWHRDFTSGPHRAWQWGALTFAMLTVIADAAQPSYGIIALESSGQTITATSSGRDDSTYNSADGGLSWKLGSSSPNAGSFYSANQSVIVFTITDPLNPNIQYRIAQDDHIDRSENAGGTWQRDLTLSASEAAEVYYQKQSPADVNQPSPVMGLVDSTTGNAIFAMAQDGVLVRKATGEWTWVSVGPYHYRRTEFTTTLSLLNGELALAISFGLLCISLLSIRCSQRLRMNSFYALFLALGWLGWVLGTITRRETMADPYMGFISVIFSWAVLGLTVVLAMVGLMIIERDAQEKLSRIVLPGVIGIPLFFFPYVLWVANWLPKYYAAMLMAIGLGAITLFVGSRVIRGFVSEAYPGIDAGLLANRQGNKGSVALDERGLKISKTDPNYVICPNCGTEQWKGYTECQKCGAHFI